MDTKYPSTAGDCTGSELAQRRAEFLADNARRERELLGIAAEYMGRPARNWSPDEDSPSSPLPAPAGPVREY